MMTIFSIRKRFSFMFLGQPVLGKQWGYKLAYIFQKTNALCISKCKIYIPLDQSVPVLVIYSTEILVQVHKDIHINLYTYTVVYSF